MRQNLRKCSFHISRNDKLSAIDPLNVYLTYNFKPDFISTTDVQLVNATTIFLRNKHAANFISQPGIGYNSMLTFEEFDFVYKVNILEPIFSDEIKKKSCDIRLPISSRKKRKECLWSLY
jgi:hypothetical protein